MSESQFLRAADGTRIGYRVHGSGEPAVVLSNGIGCNEVFLRHLSAALAQRFRVIEWHYRGHLDSAVPAKLSHLDFPYLLDDLELVLAATGVAQAVFVGFSMGVQINFEFYRRHPDRVLGLVPICGTYEYCLKSFFGVPVFQYLFPLALLAVRRQHALMQRIWRRVLGNPLAYLGGRLLIFDGRRFTRSDFRDYQPHILALDLRCFLEMAAFLAQHSARDLLPRIAVPTLIIAGTKDNFTPLRVSREMAELIPHAQLVEIKGGSHATPAEYPEQVNPAVLEFAEGLIPPLKGSRD